MSKRLVAGLLVAAAMLLATPAAAQYAEPAVLSSSSGSNCVPGSPVTLTVDGAAPGTDVTFIFESDPTVLGVATADENGLAVLVTTWPSNASQGDHTVTAQGLDGRPEGGPTPLDLTVEVVCAPAAGQPLARTGADSLPWVQLGLALLVVGGFVLLASRRRYAVVRETV